MNLPLRPVVAPPRTVRTPGLATRSFFLPSLGQIVIVNLPLQSYDFPDRNDRKRIVCHGEKYRSDFQLTGLIKSRRTIEARESSLHHQRNEISQAIEFFPLLVLRSEPDVRIVQRIRRIAPRISRDCVGFATWVSEIPDLSCARITLGGRAPRNEKRRTLCEPLVNDYEFEEIIDRDSTTVSLAANGPSLMSQIN